MVVLVARKEAMTTNCTKLIFTTTSAHRYVCVCLCVYMCVCVCGCVCVCVCVGISLGLSLTLFPFVGGCGGGVGKVASWVPHGPVQDIDGVGNTRI